MTLDDARLKELLAACDHAAVENVRAGIGGPFAASLHVYHCGSGIVTDVAGPVGNAVISTGLASAHAEDRLIVPENVARLRRVLAETGVRDSAVYAISSAESCPACHAKIEILARVLVRDGLLLPGRFFLVYGAGYQETRDVAGFHDAPYHEDLSRDEAGRMIRIVRGRPDGDLPAALRADLVAGRAAVVTGPGRIFIGRDDRQDDIIATPEVSAIRAACHAARASGADAPWDLDGAVLYAPGKAVGPLMYAESQWAHIGTIITAGEDTAPEAPDISNDAFFDVVAARPYNGAGVAVHVRRVLPFDNLAQKEWARLSAEHPERYPSYNGHAEDQD